MTINEFLSHLRKLDIKIWADGDRLRLNAPKGVLTPDLQAELAERKAEILVFLRETAASDALEERLASIWEEVLGMSAVSRDDNFFELGRAGCASGRPVGADLKRHLGVPVATECTVPGAIGSGSWPTFYAKKAEKHRGRLWCRSGTVAFGSAHAVPGCRLLVGTSQ